MTIVTHPAVVTVTDADVRYQRDYRDGADKFARGLNLCQCSNEAERDGYMAALQESLDYMAEYSIENDYDFIRTGC